MRQVPDPKKPIEDRPQSCDTELFLTQLKSTLDHKTEKSEILEAYQSATN